MLRSSAAVALACAAVVCAHPIRVLHGEFAARNGTLSLTLAPSNEDEHGQGTLAGVSVFDRAGEPVEVVLTDDALAATAGPIERWPVSVAYQPEGRNAHPTRVVFVCEDRPERPLVLRANAPGARLDQTPAQGAQAVPEEPLAVVVPREGVASIEILVPLSFASVGIVRPDSFGSSIGAGDPARETLLKTLARRMVSGIGSGEPVSVRLVIPSAENPVGEPVNTDLAWCRIVYDQRLAPEGATEMTLPFASLGLDSIAVEVHSLGDEIDHGIVTASDSIVRIEAGRATRIGRREIVDPDARP